MIRVKVRKEGDRYLALSCKGHAGYAEHGSDIVCAAVSILVINTINSIASLTKCRIEVSEDEKTGKILADFPDGSDVYAGLLMDSMIAGLQSVEEQYGRSYVRLEIQ